jgi:signal peptidase II
MGNCFDRLVYGHVRDFIYFDLINWPIFNFADSMLVCGAGILMLQAIFVDPHRADAPIASASATAPEIGRD